ncbi:MAG: formimidoylglutamate deiminase [Tetrasphaera sp.]|nr:formimidoylglutamate deiminase [Tetrasphaera sp.]
MTSWFCDYAVLPRGVRRNVRITTQGDRIVSVTPRTRQQPTDEHLRGVTSPGIANGHSHAFHRALRGRTHGDGGNFWTWREQMYAVTQRLDPQTYGRLARAVYAEMLLAGYTVVGEFHYVHHAPGGRPYGDPNAMGNALIEAAREVGIRMTMLDTCYLSGGLQGAGHEPLDPVQQRFSDGSVDAWADRVGQLQPDAMTRVGAAVHSVRAVPRDDIAAVARIAGEGLGGVPGPMPLHVHVSEQPGENLACEVYYGCSPTELLHSCGALGPCTTAIHGSHLSERDIALWGEMHGIVCFCPTTERDLADGIGPARELASVGTRICIGSDQHAVIDPFEEVRGIEMHERLKSLERGRFGIGELVDMATTHGYQSLGWCDGGQLREGWLADFVTIRLDSPRTAGCGPEQIAYAATSADVTDVVVGGSRVVEHGAHAIGDVGRLLREAIVELRRPV